MSAYPNAYCVKCGSHTDTLQKHTVVLQNNARALRGICGSCETEVYKILPKLKDAPKHRMSEDERRKYPDAYCVKCHSHTPTINAHTVILDNKSRAVHGCCKNCNSEVYRIIGSVEPALRAAKMPAKKLASHPVGIAPRSAKAMVSPARSATPTQRMPVVPMTRRVETAQTDGRASFLVAAGVIAAIVAAFVVLAAH